MKAKGLWRRLSSYEAQWQSLFPRTVGTVAHYMDIHRGDRFDYMVSVSSQEASLSAY